jgi:hypothetical protein
MTAPFRDPQSPPLSHAYKRWSWRLASIASGFVVASGLVIGAGLGIRACATPGPCADSVLWITSGNGHNCDVGAQASTVITREGIVVTCACRATPAVPR